MDKNYKVIKSNKLSTKYEDRYVIVNAETEELLDDAQGYGYKTPQKAHACWKYKTRDKSKDKEKAEKRKIVKTWAKEHKDFMGVLEADAFCIIKGSYGPDDKFDAKWIKNQLKEFGYTNLDFSPSDLLRYIQKGDKY